MPTISQYADQIMIMIDEDIAAGALPGLKRMPADVDSFTALHDYRDANCYLLDLFNAHEIDSPGARFVFSEQGTDVCNAICDEVARRLAERAPRIRRQMAETVLFAIAAGFDGMYGEYSQTGEYFNADPDDFEVDDEDVDAAVAWLSAGRLSPGDWILALDAAEGAVNESEADGEPADAAEYRALLTRLRVQRGARLTSTDLRVLSAALCLSIATCDPRCIDDMPPMQDLAQRVARQIDALADDGAAAERAALFAWAHDDCDGRFAFHERLPSATVYACGVCGQHRVQQDDPAAHAAAMASLADALIEAADATEG